MMENRTFLKCYASSMLCAAAATLGAGFIAWWRGRRVDTAPAPPPQEPAARESRPVENAQAETDATRHVARRVIQYFVIPIWLVSGLTDWWCHRRTDIEHTTGLKESGLHLLMLGEAAFPVLAGLFMEIDVPVLSFMIASFFVHEATAMWDVSYAVTRREVQPVEQHVHSFLEMVPLMAVSLIAVLHWPQVQALLGRRVIRSTPPRLKREPLGLPYALGALGMMAVFEVLPYCEEALRDWKANPGRLTPPAVQPA
ncbi:hypothetical protein KTQ54_00555 [Komagataeibacter oboediens]|uniref:hypothetical protein n=1 Tax=Komagataeibacter oboediens TaxID=65958 RepID=UPI001C2C919F|nr:hypothetical protein [Komagataeibacter oboediens]MBV0887040.1 hypothetical protein [Komagataeibacter oboediens]MCK9820408.1 hypothetical protein [Komagataeibacter oboediens]